MPVKITDPFVLPCGVRLGNRLAKAAITEGLADARGWPTPELDRLYAGWATSGFGLMISGNIIVDGDHLERPGNVVLQDDPEQLPALRRWTAAARRGARAAAPPRRTRSPPPKGSRRACRQEWRSRAPRA